MKRRTALALLGVAVVGMPATAAQSASATADGLATVVSVTGGGFGHGVGMSQYGAFGQATEGRTAEQILPYYFTGTHVGGVPDARDIRVNLAHAVEAMDLSAADATPVTTPGAPHGSWRIAVGSDAPLVLKLHDKVRVRGTGASIKVHVVRDDGSVVDVTGPSIHVEWGGSAGALAASPATVVTIGGDVLRHGTVTLTPSKTLGGPADRIEAVTSLPLHTEYLYGLAEMPSSWPKEALRAQAVAARSYALRTVLDKPDGQKSCGYCHVYDSDASQVFRGWTKESQVVGGVDYGALWRAAVDATTTDAGNGLAVLDAAGTVLRTYYFSSSGGRTRNSESVWSTPLPYAKSVDDHWSQASYNPYASWTVQIPAGQVASKFGLGSLSSLTVVARDGADAATVLEAVDGNGVHKQMKGEDFRHALDLRSSYVRTIALDSDLAVVNPPRLSPPYREAGAHTLRGRQWLSSCTTYSRTLRCVAQPYGTYYVADPKVRGGVLRKQGYQAAATAYTAPVSPIWDTNPNAKNGSYVDSHGRNWTVTCTVPTGPRLCVSTVHASVLVRVRVKGKYRLARADRDLVRTYVRLVANL